MLALTEHGCEEILTTASAPVQISRVWSWVLCRGLPAAPQYSLGAEQVNTVVAAVLSGQ